MNIRDEIDDALEEMEGLCADESGETQKLILPSGAQLPCVPSTEEVGTEVQIGPKIQVIQAVVRVRKSLFVTADLVTLTVDSDLILADNDTPRLRSGKKPQFRGKTYRVAKVSEDPAGAYFRIYLVSAK